MTAVTDVTYREAFFEEVVGEVRAAFAVRALYVDMVGSPETKGAAAEGEPA